jgi:hypothetical protein
MNRTRRNVLSLAATLPVAALLTACGGNTVVTPPGPTPTPAPLPAWAKDAFLVIDGLTAAASVITGMFGGASPLVQSVMEKLARLRALAGDVAGDGKVTVSEFGRIASELLDMLAGIPGLPGSVTVIIAAAKVVLPMMFAAARR